MEIRPDLIGAALLEGVAGSALLGRGLTLGDVGAGEKNGKRLGRSGGSTGTGGSAFFRGREVITWNGGLMGRKQAAGDDIDADHEEKRGENGACDLIGLDIHE
jgi:hypothetical protein